MSSLSLQHIAKRYGETEVLSDISFAVEDGGFCVLLGPSGCGKSTLLTIVAGLLPQDSGSVLMDGASVDHLSPRERDVAMVFQNYALYPHMTVAENLAFGLRMRKTSRDEIDIRVSQTANLLSIEHLLKRKPRALSGGQQQRVAMGRALVRRPRLFLLDEPLSNLDARLRADVRLELKRLHRQIQGTTLYVTHDQVEAMTLGDTVVVLESGNIRQIDSPENIYDRPADTFVARFIGSPEMNLYSGQLACRGNTCIFAGNGFSLNFSAIGRTEDGPVQLGLRPEDIRVGNQEEMVFTAEIEMLDHVGSECYIHGKIGREPITVRTGKRPEIRAGESLPFSVSLGRIHLFRNGKRHRLRSDSS